MGGATLAEIEAVYRLRLGDLRSTAAAILGEREGARDVVQDAFALAVRRRRSFRGRGPLDAWLWRLVVNTALTARRRQVPFPGTVEPADPQQNGKGDEAERVQLAISLLPERQRLVVFLRFYADLDYATIGTVLGIREGTVAATLNAARATLRRALEQEVTV